MILESKNVAYEVIDITEPGREDEKEFMQTMSKARDSKYPLPPQIFNEEDYCGVNVFLLYFIKLYSFNIIFDSLK